MATFMEHIGGLIDRIKGTSYTRTYTDVPRSEVHHVQSNIFGDEFSVTITSHRRIYLTTFRRWWIFNRRTTVYEVSCEAAADARSRLDPLFFTPVTYPLLCSRLLQWTPYPHIYAINAFLGQMRKTRTVHPSTTVV
jgi:hypothetical protein